MEKCNFNLIIVLFVFIALAATFFSCENPQNPTPPQGRCVTWEDLDYWQDYHVGDMFAYVNEENDSIVFVVTEKFREYNGYPKLGDEDYDSTEVIETYDDHSIGIVCLSENNFLNDTIEMRQYSTLWGESYWFCTFFSDKAHKKWYFLDGEQYSCHIPTVCDNISEILSDTLSLTVPWQIGTNPCTYDCGGIAIRGKGTIWWVDWDGHRWELVDLMNK